MLDNIKQGDKIISTLNLEETKKFLAVKNQYDELDYFRRKMVRAHNKFQAMQIMFWEDMMGKHERCETASHRGKVLSTRKLDNKLVVIERVQEMEEEDDMEENGGNPF